MKAKMPQYEYINLDSGWSETCDKYGRWTYREDLFPNGLRALSDHLQQNNQKLGLYMLPGLRKEALEGRIKGHEHIRIADLVTQKKQGNAFKGATFMPDEHSEHVQAYYDSIADLYAEWGIGYIKIDGCGPSNDDQDMDTRKCLYMMHKAFSKHNIWIELSWSLDPAYAEEWMSMSNGARIYADIESYSSKYMTTSHRVFQRMAYVAKWCDKQIQGKKFYIDLDAVLVGMTVDNKCVDGLDNDDVRISYVSFWALVSSVFCIGADPRKLPQKYLALLNHPVILDIHQSGVIAKPIGNGNAWLNRKQVWWKTLPDGRLCVGLFNAHVYPFMLGLSREIRVDFEELGVDEVEAKDAWTGEPLGRYAKSYSTMLRPGQCQLLLLSVVR
ncbi:glycoside hydrolase superfamily [Zychaea mexicana]|uniref:glycoside hydrolase superfamily n=1 Tax=Zychaea mexicana TaxID=64656 RepID=UPI0022FF33C5|nr:glycoside hydrolase superfamily [Zychaea mexicana]KAI9488897.1 glycoside hydrolase superfamily [Zychaea mexicana]